MKTLSIDSKAIVLILTTLLTGLLAGVFFTWTNAITPGIGRLSDLGYLQAFQQMNRTILNPLFYFVIISPLFLSPICAYLYRGKHGFILLSLVGASILYFLGVFVVTMWGNIPLNEMLNKTNLEDISLDDAKTLRDKFEGQWNYLHLIRTITSASSFLLLILACILKTDNKIIN